MTADEDDIMTFKADVIRDPMKDIDDMVVLGEIGSFGKARALFEESLAQYSDAFPISAEYLRLLYDQGDYTSLKNADSYIPKPRTGADGTVLAWSSDQEMVVDLMCKSGEAHYHSHSKEIHDVIEIETEDVFRRCQAFELEKLTEEQTLSLVLLCKLLYWRHEHHRSVHDVNFEFDGHSPQKLVEHFLRRKNYWAAENLLQICFRRTSEDHQEIHIEQIWESIEGFLVETEADQSRGVLLARIAVLESFCENLLRRELALQDNEPNEHRRWSWETAMEALTKSVNAFAKLEDIETSRISLRKQLIDFDKSSETQSLDSSSAAEMPDPQILHALLQHAHENDDRQLKDGINWRIDVLVHHREPRGMSTPALVPFTIYQRLWYLAMDVSQLASHAQQNGVEESEIPEFMLSTACRLYHAYQQSRELRQLDHAIESANIGIEFTNQSGSLYAAYLANIGVFLKTRYERTGQMQDLDNSIQAARQAVDMIPLDHPDLAGRLNNLGNRLWSRYQRMGQRQDLDDAIQAARQAVDATTVDHSNRVAMLSNLGMWLGSRYVRTGQMQDLDDAIHAARQAVDATPLDHPNRAGRSNNLGICLHSRYQQTGKSRDLEDAIHAARQAVDATPSDHPDRAGMLNNLGNWLGIRYKRTEQMLDLEDASRCHLQAYDCTAAVPLTRVRAAAGGLTKLANLDRVHEAIVLGKGALALLPIVRARNLDLSDQQFMLSGFAGIASNLCALLLSEGRVHEAVEFLEQGRAVIISQLLDDRSDLTDLSEDHPQLCQRYQVLVNEVNSPFGGGNDNTTATIAKITRRREAVTELEACIADIRASPKYERFLLGPTIDEMQDSIDDGCVVIVNVSQLGCDAVILSKKSLQAIPLSELRVEIATSWLSKKWQSKKSERREKNDEFLKYLAWLWRVCAQPILDHVSALYTQQIKTHPPPRVWWIGCGFACSMPFHAAGIHNDKSEENVFSRVLSSYTPSIKALGYARDQMTNAWSDLSVRNQMLITLMPKTPKLGALKGVLDETDDIIRIVSPHMSPDVCPTPDAETVLRHLEKCEIAHFACHGTSDSIDPSKSGLVLQRDAVDGRPEQDHLSVHRISRLQLRHAKIAYLSACSTAENKNVRLRDEVIHIVSGFQVAGFPHVIGSLWPAGDAECVQVASGFYSKLFKDGGVSGIGDRQVACALQEAVMAVRAGNLDMPLNWAQYVHFGA